MSTTHAVRPGAGAWVQLTLHEARMVIRDSSGLVVPLGLPVLIMVMNGLGSARDPIDELGGLTGMNAYVLPATLTIVVALIGMVNMPSFLSMYRKTGVLRRMSVTPAHPAMVLVAQVLVSLVQTLIGIAIALGVGAAAFGVVVPRNLAGAALVMTLGIAAMYAIGMFIAAVAPTVNSAIAIGMVAFLGTMALGGGFAPASSLPSALATIGEALPFGAMNAGLSAAWIGEAPDFAHVAALAVAVIVAGGLSAKWFRWQ